MFRNQREPSILAIMQFREAVFKVLMIVQEIDIISEHCLREKLRDGLEGLDTKLAFAYSHLRNEAQNIAPETDLLADVEKSIGEAVKGVQLVTNATDNGDYLRAVVAAPSWKMLKLRLEAFISNES